ncbi:2OG-Fe(II) oxygenase family protein [Burkholderia sp. Bp8963]|uniref:2OG-Fe(II) oxygenase family protein n=1 Tax=Burkholderia sp. Bp8963 TaxID=2184547 RepID=UPI00163A1447|nr:2OG-Fe(II) oxygenase family protein [Burkholderia sp. Bp8963]
MQTSMKLYASRLIRDSYVYFKMPYAMLMHFNRIVASYESLDRRQKRAFSFPEETDGFLPFGLEYSNTPERPDLCERFCYWAARRNAHQGFPLVKSEFYRTMAAYETCINVVAQNLLDAVCENLGGTPQLPVRNSSYLQFCEYNPDYCRYDREYLQDPHEDGHLLSFIKPTAPGLVLFPDSAPVSATPRPDEMIVLAGSLLEALTDGEIPAMQHAVERPRTPAQRKSLMYFVNPDLSAQHASSIVNRQPLDLQVLADRRHTAFGNNTLRNPRAAELE